MQNSVDLKLNPILTGQELREVDKFCYLGNYISPEGRKSDGAS